MSPGWVGSEGEREGERQRERETEREGRRGVVKWQWMVQLPPRTVDPSECQTFAKR